MPGIKDAFLAEILADVPEGIRDYLNVEIPAPPEVGMPTDVDSAILVNGICAWYVLELFRPLAGLNLVQIPMYLGQLNTVSGGMLLASLEYNEESQAEQDFEISEPIDGSVYSPGELRITATATNSTIIDEMKGTIGEASFDMVSKDDVWRQFVNLTENGDYTLTLTAVFPEGDPLPKSVSFTISDNPDDEPTPPEGDDETALQRAYENVNSGYAKLMKAVASWTIDTNMKDAVTAYYQEWKTAISSFLAIAKTISKSETIVQNAETDLSDRYYPDTAEAIYTEDVEALETNWIPGIMSLITHINSIAESV